MVEERKLRQGYKKTEVGVIPEDWEVVRLDEVSDIMMGQSPSSKFYNNNQLGLPLVQGNADIKNRKTIKRIYTTEVTKKCNKDDLIMTVRAPVGKIAKASYDSCLGRGVCAIKGGQDYLYHFLISMEERWTSISKGSTFDSINSEDVYNLKLLFHY